jgi:isopropylmalate/homocitrate/citramalate synthase
MNSSFKAAADVQKLANTFAVLQELADALKKLGSLEQYEAELQAKVAKYEQTIKDTEARFVAERDGIETIKATASAQAESLLMQAQAERELIVAQAKEMAASILEQAQQTLDDATETKEEALKKLQEAKEEVTQINNDVLALEKRADSAKAFLSKLTAS